MFLALRGVEFTNEFFKISYRFGKFTSSKLQKKFEIWEFKFWETRLSMSLIKNVKFKLNGVKNSYLQVLWIADCQSEIDLFKIWNENHEFKAGKSNFKQDVFFSPKNENDP